MAELSTHPLKVAPEPVSLEPNPLVDSLIFYLRFMESMTHTYWLDQVFSPDRQLGAARNELARQIRRNRQMELEILEKRRQLISATRALAAATS